MEPIVQRGHLRPAGGNPEAGREAETAIHVIFNSNRQPPPGQEHAYMHQLATRLDQFCQSTDNWMSALREVPVIGRRQSHGAFSNVRRSQVRSIQWSYRVELGPRQHRVHFHLYPTIIHTTRLQFDKDVLIAFLAAALPWIQGGWSRIILLPSSDYRDQMRQYIEEDENAHQRRGRPRRRP